MKHHVNPRSFTWCQQYPHSSSSVVLKGMDMRMKIFMKCMCNLLLIFTSCLINDFLLITYSFIHVFFFFWCIYFILSLLPTMLIPENSGSKVGVTSDIYCSFNSDFPSNIWTGILPQSVPQNLFVGIAENQAIWLETVQMKESATPVERQGIVLETAQLLHFLLVTWSCAITASSKATLQSTAPMTRRAKTVGKLVTWHVIVRMIPCAIYAIYQVI